MADSARPDADAEAKNAAESAPSQAVNDASAAKLDLDKALTELGQLDVMISAAVDAVLDAQTDTARSAASARLKTLQKEQAELKVRVAAARGAATKAERSHGKQISRECLDNPLARGCM